MLRRLLILTCVTLTAGNADSQSIALLARAALRAETASPRRDSRNRFITRQPDYSSQSGGADAGDTTPPSVTAVTPAANSRNVALNATVRVAFDEAIDPATVNTDTIQLRDTRNAVVEGTVSYDASLQIATFVPSVPLLPTRPYRGVVVGGTTGTAIRDSAGNPLAAGYSWTFVSAVEPNHIAAGTSYSVAVDSTGQVWTWGGAAQQRGQTADARIPAVVPGASGIVSVAAGNSHTLALKTDGTVLAWGSNGEGQLGINSQTAQSVPVAVMGLTDVVGVAAGAANSVALKVDGTVWTWGSAHQIGNGQTARRLVPGQVPALTDVIAIASGDVAVYALKGDGTVWAWGDNTSGQIGDGSGGTGVIRLIPVQVASLTEVVGIAAGAQHALAILGTDLSVRAWGLNTNGQIGDGTTNTPRYTPVMVAGLVGVRAVDGAGTRSLAALLDGSVKVWGSGATSTGGAAASPIGASGNPQGVQVTGNVNHNLAVSATGVMWTWGVNASGQLGDGTTVDRRSAGIISGENFAWKVGSPTFSVAAGTYSQVQNVKIATATPAAAIHYTLNGGDPTEADPLVPSTGVVVVDRTLTLKAAAWKSGSPPSNVTSATYTLQPAPTAFSPSGGTFSSATKVTLSTSTAGAAIHFTIDGSTPSAASAVYSAPIDVNTTTTVKAIATRAGWLDSPLRSATFTFNFGTVTPPTLTPVPGTFEGSVVVSLSAQLGATVRYTTNGSTPTSTSTAYSSPLTLTTSTTIKAKAFRTDFTTSAEASGTYTILAVAPVISRESGTYAPGTRFTVTDSDPATIIRVTFNGQDPVNTDPAIASGTTLLVGNFAVKARGFKSGTTNSSVSVADFALTEPFSTGAVGAGGTHSLLATPGGLLYAWGMGSSGQLGLGSTVNKTTPTVVPTLTGVVAVAAGTAHTLALTWDGRLFAWGSNGSGRLGDGTTTARTLPVEIAGVSNVVAVAAGSSHSLALTADGYVYAWGNGGGGQLGLGSTANVLIPTLLPSLSGVVSIAAGSSHSLAVTSAGELYAWGMNSSSQLGDGGQTRQLTPKRITLTGVIAVSAGTIHSLARLYDGRVYAWGNNTNGELGLGDTITRRVPTLIPDLVANDIAAGDSYSMARTSDGMVLAWGANSNGQVGDTTTITPRPTPVAAAVPGPVSKIAAGSSHSLAVTPNGHVWTWGSDGSGQLGDGIVTAKRPIPMDVFAGGGAWTATPPPILSLAPGVYNSIQTVVVTRSPGSSVEMHYTTSGAAPDLSDPVIADGTSLTIDRTLTLKVRAWTSDGVPSAIVTAAYVLQPALPSITPAGAAYTTPQTVTLATATGDTVLRYTIDGTEPSISSPLYSGPINVDTLTVFKAKAFRDDWTPSVTATSTFTFNFGYLPAPVVTPPGGHYAPGQAIAITAHAGDQVRFTLDGTDPLETSTAYVSPLVLPTGFITIKARAYNVDWTASQVTTESYVITEDATPPTITASFSPLPNAQGWNTGDVTVTFTCNDDSGIKWCTPPTRIAGEGFALPVSGSAVDVWGNHTTTTWTVNIDRTPPDIHIYAPRPGGHLPSGSTSITVRGSAQDVSGIDMVQCNGALATVVNDAFVCGVSVTDGTNLVTVIAFDRAGRSGSTQISLVVGPLTVSDLDISPATMLMIAGESREIFVKDQEGNERHDGTWTIADQSVAAVVDAGGIITLTALSPGQTTVSAVVGSARATATVNVLGVGDAVPSGSTLWSLSDRSGFDAPKRGYVLRAWSTAAQEDPSRAAALLFVDEGTEYFGKGTALTRGFPNRPTRIRTTTADGRQLSDFSFDGRIPRQIAADNSGGFVLVFPNAEGQLGTIERVDAATGTVTWEYVSFVGSVSDVAIHPDGTTYATEKQINGVNHLLAIDVSGTVSRLALPAGHFTKTDLGECGWDDSSTRPGYTTGPIIRDDGAVVVVTTVRTSTQIVRTQVDPNNPLGCTELPWASEFSFENHEYVVEKLADGDGLISHELSDSGGFLPIQFREDEFYLLPDGLNGLLVANRQAPYVLRISGAYEVTGTVGTGQLMPNDPATSYDVEYVLGEDALYALVNARATTQMYPSYEYAFTAKVVRVDPATLAPIGTPIELGDPMPDPQHVRLRFALAGGGVYANGPWSAYPVNVSGDTSAFAASGNASYVAGDIWAGFTTNPTAAFGSAVEIASTSWSNVRANAQGSNAAANERTGILAKGHSVAGVGGHISLRLIPRDQERWRSDSVWGRWFTNYDLRTHSYFATVGAGPSNGGDSTTNCGGSIFLASDLNRDGDVNSTAVALEKLHYLPSRENELIREILERAESNYHDDELPYCFIPTLSPFFNSNSFAAGLLKATSITPPQFPAKWTLTPRWYAGWDKPVPTENFNTH